MPITATPHAVRGSWTTRPWRTAAPTRPTLATHASTRRVIGAADRVSARRIGASRNSARDRRLASQRASASHLELVQQGRACSFSWSTNTTMRLT